MVYIVIFLTLIVIVSGLYISYILTEYQIAKKGYKAYISSSPRWKRKAAECKRRAGNRCQICNSPNGLQAHHRFYGRLFNEHPDDLTCLCASCHALFTANGKLHKPLKSPRPTLHKMLGL